MPRHHTIPQMHLRNFADAAENIIMVSRVDLEKRIPTRVKTAGAERGFYRIPTEDIVADKQADHDPESVEKLFSKIEGDAAEIVRSILDGDFPLDRERRDNLAYYMALTYSRGWRYRTQSNSVYNLVLQQFLQGRATDSRVRQFLKSSGEDHGPEDVARFRDRICSEDGRIELSQSHQIRESVEVAVRKFAPEISSRSWRLISFPDNCLLTSDNPIGLWSPEAGSIGIGTAKAIFFPIDRTRSLSLVRGRGEDRLVDGGRTRMLQVNNSVASTAEKWIYHHPDDDPLAQLEIGPPVQLEMNSVARTESDANGVSRELFRIAKRGD